MIHSFPKHINFEDPHEFTDPFRYVPHPSVLLAAELTIRKIESDPALSAAFSEGKMLGVMVCKPLCYIAAFSGNVGGKSIIEGFVPPIYDLMAPEGYFKSKEAEISTINREVIQLEESLDLKELRKSLNRAETDMAEAIESQKARMSMLKKERDEMRRELSDSSIHASLIKESQYEKAELKRLKKSWEDKIAGIRNDILIKTDRIDRLKKHRAMMSDNLQGWIFRQYIVHNAEGEETSIADIFSREGLIPPGGTGECAAPKLLEYAYKNGLEPLAMGEFWYGKSPETAVRTHGHFYPSCTSKCGPLLNFMLKGLKDKEEEYKSDEFPVIIYEDESIIVVEKPSGMPSVPGLNGRESLQEWLDSVRDDVIYPVHRLDMDTSGIMLFAKTADAAVNLRRQFEEHSIRKTYMARIVLPHSERHMIDMGNQIVDGTDGFIDLPLAPDHDERPRQKVDFRQGKNAYTEYKVLKINPDDGTADMILRPHTGRTHQLRVHCAHTLGLGCPILGDLLYGSYSSQSEDKCKAERLCLHASSITFRHPETDMELTFSANGLCY